MDKDLISIIVPVYNVGKKLVKCVNSIINQTYKNLEIVLIDDGSNDGTEKICDDYLKIDNRIIVIHKKNGGVSTARNIGIKKSNGKYIAFVDSDDFVTVDFVEFLYKNMVENNAQISCCGCCKYFNDEKKEMIFYPNIRKKYNKIEAHKYLNITGYFGIAVRDKMFLKELFNYIKFPNKKNGEDLDVLYKAIEKAGGLFYDSEIKYYWVQRKGSITNSGETNSDILDVYDEMIKFYKEKKYNQVIPYAIQSYVLACIGIYNTIMINKNDKKEMKKYRKKILQEKKYVTYENLNQKRKIQLILFYNNIFLYNIIFKIYNKIRETKCKKIEENK